MLITEYINGEINDETLKEMGFVYKSYKNYIITLQKTKNTVSNEYTYGKNKKYATYTGTNLLVVAIHHKFEDKKLDSIYDQVFTYKVGEIMKPENGYHYLYINYFLCLERAYYQDIIYDNKYYTGLYKEWYDDGQSKIICKFMNGKYIGNFIEFYDDSSIKRRCTYMDGILHGKYEFYSLEGKMIKSCHYINGVMVSK